MKVSLKPFFKLIFPACRCSVWMSFMSRGWQRDGGNPLRPQQMPSRFSWKVHTLLLMQFFVVAGQSGGPRVGGEDDGRGGEGEGREGGEGL